MTTKTKPWLTCSEAAAFAGVWEQTIRNHIADGTLDSKEIDGVTHVRTSKLTQAKTKRDEMSRAGWLTVAEAAAFSGLSPRTVLRRVSKGTLTTRRHGRANRVWKGDLTRAPRMNTAPPKGA